MHEAGRHILVFDLDDTLYPERQFALSGFRAAGAWAERALGVCGLEVDMIRLLDAGHLGALFQMALAARKPDHAPEDLAGLLDAWRHHEPEIALFEDAAWALHQFGARGGLGLVTDGHHRTQAAKVAALGIARHFDEIVYTGALAPNRAFHKPHPRAFEQIEARLGHPDRQLVYVGDNPAKDFVAPNARGWITVMVARTGGIHDPTAVAAGGAPRHVVDSLRDLPRVLEP